MLGNLLPNDFILSRTYLGLIFENQFACFWDFSSWGKISTLPIFSQWTGITNQQAEMINSA